MSQTGLWFLLQAWGELCRWLGWESTAERTYRRVLARWPDDPAALFYRAGLLVDLRRFAEAVSLYRRYIALKPGSATGWLLLANALQQSGNHEEAVGAYRAAMERAEELPASVPFNLGVSLRELERWDEAVDAFRDAWHRDRDNPERMAALGQALTRAGRIDEAIHFYQVECSKSQTPELILGLTEALRLARHETEVMAVLEAGLDRFPDSGPLRAQFAMTMADQNRIDEALQVLETQVLCSLEEGLALAEILGRRDRHVEAIDVLRRLADAYPADSDAPGMLGWALLESRGANDALKAFDQALKRLNVQRPPPSEREENLWRANLMAGRAAALAELGRRDEAMQAMKNALSLDPTALERDSRLQKYFGTTGEA